MSHNNNSLGLEDILNGMNINLKTFLCIHWLELDSEFCCISWKNASESCYSFVESKESIARRIIIFSNHYLLVFFHCFISIISIFFLMNGILSLLFFEIKLTNKNVSELWFLFSSFHHIRMQESL